MRAASLAVAVMAMIGTVGHASALHGQTKAKSSKQSRQLRFEKLRTLPPGVIDSFVTVNAVSKRVAVRMVFNNPCGFHPRGRYSVAGDTLFFLIRHKSSASESATCTGGQWYQGFVAATDTLQSGRYTFRIVMERGARGAQTYWGHVEF